MNHLEGDRISRKIIRLIHDSGEPLETKEVIFSMGNISRIKILYRLNNLRGDGLIKGKQVGSGKGAWIWWRKDE